MDSDLQRVTGVLAGAGTGASIGNPYLYVRYRISQRFVQLLPAHWQNTEHLAHHGRTMISLLHLKPLLTLLDADVPVIPNNATLSNSLPLLVPLPHSPGKVTHLSHDSYVICYFTGCTPILCVCMRLECIVDVYGRGVRYATHH